MAFKADYSPEWRANAVDYLVGRNPFAEDLSDEALLLLAVSLLICDDDGGFYPSQIDEALLDPSVVNAASNLLQKAREAL
jgi:hypothetical protein